MFSFNVGNFWSCKRFIQNSVNDVDFYSSRNTVFKITYSKKVVLHSSHIIGKFHGPLHVNDSLIDKN